MSTLKDYIVAAGPHELREALSSLLVKTHQDAIFANQSHYILYQLGTQQSLLKVDLRGKPFEVWHYDLLMRSATDAVRRTVAQFLWEQGGEQERQWTQAINFDSWYEKNFSNQWVNDISGKARLNADPTTSIDTHQDKLAQAFSVLASETRKAAEKPPTRRWGFFKLKEKITVSTPESLTAQLKKT